MHSSTPKDILTLVALTCLSTGMLLCSRVLSLHLDLRPAAPHQLTAASLERLTGMVLGLLGALILTWLALSLLLAFVAACSTRLGHHKIGARLSGFAPGFLARLAAAAVGGSLALAGPANAANPDTGAGCQTISRTSTSPTVLSAAASPDPVPGWVPGQGTASESGAAETSVLSPGWIPQPVSLPLQRILGGAARPSPEVVVRPGDTLWSIAARHMPPGATAGQVAEAWPRWYAANRESIGPDPDQLAVGLVLQAPQHAGDNIARTSRHQTPTRSTP